MTRLASTLCVNSIVIYQVVICVYYTSLMPKSVALYGISYTLRHTQNKYVPFIKLKTCNTYKKRIKIFLGASHNTLGVKNGKIVFNEAYTTFY